VSVEKELAEARQQLTEEIRRRTETEAEIVRISELERLRFGMDLHDDICQRLAGISMLCKSLLDNPSPQQLLPELLELIDDTLARTRRYARDSYPPELDTHGLKNSLSALCEALTKQSSCPCVLSWTGPEKPPLTPAQNLNIYRIVQEALNNAVKHSGASRIDVRVERREKRKERREQGTESGEQSFSVIVQDNGRGDPCLSGENPSGGLGLRTMRYRARQLGAEFILESSEQGGTRVGVRIRASRQGAEALRTPRKDESTD